MHFEVGTRVPGLIAGVLLLSHNFKISPLGEWSMSDGYSMSGKTSKISLKI